MRPHRPQRNKPASKHRPPRPLRAYSGVLKDVMDYSTAFCDGDGHTVAQLTARRRPLRPPAP